MSGVATSSDGLGNTLNSLPLLVLNKGQKSSLRPPDKRLIKTACGLHSRQHILSQIVPNKESVETELLDSD